MINYAERVITSIAMHTKLARPYRSNQQGMIINEQILVAKKKTLFKQLGMIDWAWYTPKGLGDALNRGEVLEYYTTMLSDSRSPSNKWRNKFKETDLKSSYSSRSGITEWVTEGDYV